MLNTKFLEDQKFISVLVVGKEHVLVYQVCNDKLDVTIHISKTRSGRYNICYHIISPDGAINGSGSTSLENDEDSQKGFEEIINRCLLDYL